MLITKTSHATVIETASLSGVGSARSSSAQPSQPPGDGADRTADDRRNEPTPFCPNHEGMLAERSAETL
jgi:hypothetical protein